MQAVVGSVVGTREYKIVYQFGMKNDLITRDDNDQGVLLSEKNGEKTHYYLAYWKKLACYNHANNILSVPLIDRGEGKHIPNCYHDLIYLGAGSLNDAFNSLRGAYLTTLYAAPLMHSEQPKKSFDVETVFSHPDLRLIDSAYSSFHGKDIFMVLVENDFQYQRLGFYSRFHDGLVSEIFNTPRTMHYYPDLKTIRISWSLGASPRDIKECETADVDFVLKYKPYIFTITKVYQNTGWKSLRQEMRDDPKLYDFVKTFYANGYGKMGRESA